jgi:hypothetical protein
MDAVLVLESTTAAARSFVATRYPVLSLMAFIKDTFFAIARFSEPKKKNFFAVQAPAACSQRTDNPGSTPLERTRAELYRAKTIVLYS